MMTAEDLITVHNLHGLPLKIQCMDTIIDVASDTFLYNVQISKLTILPHHKQTLQPSRTLARPQLHLGFLTQEQTTMSHQICQILTTLKHTMVQILFMSAMVRLFQIFTLARPRSPHHTKTLLSQIFFMLP